MINNPQPFNFKLQVGRGHDFPLPTWLNWLLSITPDDIHENNVVYGFLGLTCNIWSYVPISGT